MKTALLLNAVNPRIGGVLIMGEKGTAKSTAVRALAELLPEIDAVDGCPFSCDPHDPASMCDDCSRRSKDEDLSWTRGRTRVVDLPIGATEDRVVGTLDIEQALTSGRKRFQPGVLARANRGILYVDEINLLEDHLVDLLLDAAAMGVNIVEREGISLAHPSRFVLVGTMNPEEGELRPQLLDRFGLCVQVGGSLDTEERMEIVRRHAEWETDPEGFRREWAEAENELSKSVESARGRVDAVAVEEAVLRSVASVCAEMGVQGHRSDITMIQSSRTLAALEGREAVCMRDLDRVLPLCLAHRMRRTPFEEEPLDRERLSRLLNSQPTPVASAVVIGGERPPAGRSQSGDRREKQAGPSAGDCEHAGEEVCVVGRRMEGARLEAVPALVEQGGNGKRQRSRTPADRGRYVGSRVPRGRPRDPAIDATLRAAAARSTEDGSPIRVAVEDVRDKIRVRKAGATIVFCVDASGSMRAKESMEAAKAAVVGLLEDAYKRRDRVGMVSFRGKRADVLLSPTSSVEQAHSRLKELPTGGTTPLAHGLATSLNILSRSTKRYSGSVPWLVLVTDGNANVPIGSGLPEQEARSMAACFRQRKINALVIDTGRMLRSETLAKEIAEAAGAQYLRLEEIGAGGLVEAVRERVGQSPPTLH